MSNMQFYFAMGVPSLLIILAWMQSSRAIARVETSLDTLGTRVGIMEHDLREFYRITGKLEGRVEALSGK